MLSHSPFYVLPVVTDGSVISRLSCNLLSARISRHRGARRGSGPSLNQLLTLEDWVSLIGKGLKGL
jgi:hypothetical protein